MKIKKSYLPRTMVCVEKKKDPIVVHAVDFKKFWMDQSIWKEDSDNSANLYPEPGCVMHGEKDFDTECFANEAPEKGICTVPFMEYAFVELPLTEGKVRTTLYDLFAKYVNDHNIETLTLRTVAVDKDGNTYAL